GTQYNILDDNIAIDIPLESEPINFEIVWKKLQKLKIDIVLQSIKNRRKKILLADMDSTIIEQECIDELADEAGVGERVAEITKRAMNGELDFEEALVERVKLLKGLSSEIITSVLKTRITLMPGAVSLIKTMKTNGSYCALVSGGFTDFTDSISKILGFDENRANTLLHKNKKLSGEVQFPILGKQAKVDALIDISKKLNYSYDDVIAVGDGANDLGMLTKAGMGVALHAKPIVATQCKARLNFANLEGLLYLQGYSKQEIL
ncbi:phosphoserine phosphatase SerB, partial [Amylibacter sp.]|nr:phosphoserine phosphatase SerB [Amylibacter sp.]